MKVKDSCKEPDASVKGAVVAIFRVGVKYMFVSKMYQDQNMADIYSDRDVLDGVPT